MLNQLKAMGCSVAVTNGEISISLPLFGETLIVRATARPEKRYKDMVAVVQLEDGMWIEGFVVESVQDALAFIAETLGAAHLQHHQEKIA